MGPGREAAGNLDFGGSPAEPSTIEGVHIRTISTPRSSSEHDASHLKTVLGGWEHSYQLPWGPWAPSRRGERPGTCLLHKFGGTFSFSSCHRTLKTRHPQIQSKTSRLHWWNRWMFCLGPTNSPHPQNLNSFRKVKRQNQAKQSVSLSGRIWELFRTNSENTLLPTSPWRQGVPRTGIPL